MQTVHQALHLFFPGEKDKCNTYRQSPNRVAPSNPLRPSGRVGTAHARNLAETRRERPRRSRSAPRKRTRAPNPVDPSGNGVRPARALPPTRSSTRASTRPAPFPLRRRDLTTQHVVQKRFSRDLGGHDVLPHPEGGEDQRQEAAYVHKSLMASILVYATITMLGAHTYMLKEKPRLYVTTTVDDTNRLSNWTLDSTSGPRGPRHGVRGSPATSSCPSRRAHKRGARAHQHRCRWSRVDRPGRVHRNAHATTGGNARARTRRRSRTAWWRTRTRTTSRLPRRTMGRGH